MVLLGDPGPARATWRGPSEAPYDLGGGAFTAVWAVPTGGWDAALSHQMGCCLAGQDIWHSEDGVQWAFAGRLGEATSERRPEDRGGVADRAGRRLVWDVDVPGSEPVTRLWSSPDGRTWTAVAEFPGSPTLVRAGAVPFSGRTTRWVLGGTTVGHSDTGEPGFSQTPTIWTSRDLDHWTVRSLPLPAGVVAAQVDALALTRHGYVAVGAPIEAGEAGGEGFDGATWLSQDGLTWVQLPTIAAPAVIADGPAGVLGIGRGTDDQPAIVWVLE